MNEWKASGGRISLLPAAPIPSGLPSALELYRRVWGGEPDSFQKPSNPLMPATAQGNRDDLTFNCMVHPTRVDFAVSPLTSFQDPAEAQFPFIRDAARLRNELIRCIGLVAKDLIPNSISRAALALQFMNVQPTFADANSVLTGVIPSRYSVRVTNEEDFIFQVNRPHSFGSENIRMNALTKWSVDRLKIVTFSVPTQGTPSISPSITTQPLIAEFISASVALDNNNAPTERLLSPTDQFSVLNEALAIAMQSLQEMNLRVEGF